MGKKYLVGKVRVANAIEISILYIGSNKLRYVALLSPVEAGLISTLSKWVHGQWSFEENLAASDFLNCCMNLDYSTSAVSQLTIL